MKHTIKLTFKTELDKLAYAEQIRADMAQMVKDCPITKVE
jgi:hypothetical protein